MAIYRKKFTWFPLLVFLINQVRFLSFEKPSTTSNRYLELDLRIFLPWLLYLFFILAAMIQLYFIDVHSSIFLLSLYVDDTIITNDDDGIAALKSELTYCFAMKDLGSLYYFLVLKSHHLWKVIFFLSLSTWLIYWLYSSYWNKTVDTRFELNAWYFTSDGYPLQNLNLYHTIVGCLIYLIITYPTIKCALHMANQNVILSTIVHWPTIAHILRYHQAFSFRVSYFHLLNP